MKAPDKIYIGRRDYGPLIGGWETQPFTSKQIESIEYIRKDALLEWAKQQQLDSLTIVADNFWQEVIDKINSL